VSDLKPLKGASRYLVDAQGQAYRREGEDLIPLKPDEKGRVWVRMDDGRRTARSLAKWHAKAFGGAPPKRGAPQLITPEQIQRARELRQTMSLREVADLIGVSHGTIYYHLQHGEDSEGDDVPT
jgi:transposase